MKWLKAAKQGDEVAMGVVGVRYILGEGVSQDVDKGPGWLWLSANSQHPHAQFVVGEARILGFWASSQIEGSYVAEDCRTQWFERRKECLNRSSRDAVSRRAIIADLMADDCLVDKKCGPPPWEWKRDEKETLL